MIGISERSAPAKLTLSLRVTGVRADGYHLLDSEMISLDLADTLYFAEGDGLTVETESAIEGPGAEPANPIPVGPDNLVVRALDAVGRRASVRLVKRIPAGAGLGGGSADAAAVLRWAGCKDIALAASIGADVPFCLRGGRAHVTGTGEIVEATPFRPQTFTLLLPPFGVDTTAVYRAWDRLRMLGTLISLEQCSNDLEQAALVVEPRLSVWRDVFQRATGTRPRLAGSGSTWFVEGAPETFGLGNRPFLALGHAKARLIGVSATQPSPT